MSATVRLLDPFRVLSEEERVEHLAAYRRFLVETDGIPDIRSRTLTNREQRMRALESAPVVWRDAVDRDAVRRFLAGDASGPFDGRTELALAAALANLSENFGVEIELRRFARRGRLPGLREADLLLPVYVQETYHCRILAELCRTCGLTFESRRPGRVMRGLIALIGALPGALRWVPVMAGEVVATAVFRLLSSRLDLFAENGAAQARLSQLLHEIWVDEVGHVAFLRAQLGPLELEGAKRLLPVVARAALWELPPLMNLGITPNRIVDELSLGIALPDEMTWLDRPIGVVSRGGKLAPA